jgi:hypothetical protein
MQNRPGARVRLRTGTVDPGLVEWREFDTGSATAAVKTSE